MPRQGDVYQAPGGTKGVSNNTIESSKFNTFVDDIVLEQNNARPIASGGTGGTNPTQARQNMDVYSTNEVDDLVSNNQPVITAYATAGNYTHTLNERTVKFQIEGCGGGGAGGGTRNVTSDGVLQGGGNSGWYGKSGLLDKGEIVEATLVVGDAGVSLGTNTSTDVANDGKASTYSDGVNSFSWGGGRTMESRVNVGGAGNLYFFGAIQRSTMSAGLRGGYSQGGKAFLNVFSGVSGEGGNSPYGAGGRPRHSVDDNNGNGFTGTGNGAGGGGCVKTQSSALAYNGGAGRPGIIIITEYLGAAED